MNGLRERVKSNLILVLASDADDLLLGVVADTCITQGASSELQKYAVNRPTKEDSRNNICRA